MSPRLRAALLDYGDTVCGFVRPEARLLEAYHQINRRLAAELQGDVPPAAELSRAVSLGVDALIEQSYVSGSELEVDIAAVYDTCLRQIGLELSPELVAWVIDQEQEAWLHGTTVAAGARDTLASLRDRGLRLCIVSNAAFPARGLRAHLAHHGLAGFFDATVYSCELGVRKPNRAIYEEALRLLGVAPAEAIFVGDRLREDVRGPRALGIHPFLTHEFRQETPAADDPVVVLRRLADLPAAISGM